MRKISAEDAARIRELAAQGKTQVEIAKLCKITQSAVSRHMLKNDVPHRTRSLYDYDPALLMRCRLEGLSAKDTARKCGISLSTVLSMWGYWTATGIVPSRNVKYSEAQLAELIALKKGGMTTHQIAVCTGCNVSFVWRYLRRHYPRESWHICE